MRNYAYVTVNSRVSPGAVNVLTNVSSNVSVTSCDMISVTVAVAVGAIVLNIVMKPDESSVVVSGGAPPEGSMTMVPGRSVSAMVISPSPAVMVMISPGVGGAVAEGSAAVLALAAEGDAEEELEGDESTRFVGGGFEAWG